MYASFNISVESHSVYTVRSWMERYPSRLVFSDESWQAWGIRQKREFIETILLGLPVPPIYVRQNDYGILYVVDGNKRLDTILKFLLNRFSLRNLPILDNLNGLYFDGLRPVYQNKLEDFELQFVVIKPPYDRFEINEVRERLNG